MNNWLLAPEADGVKMTYAYDLKGCADDKTLTWDGVKVRRTGQGTEYGAFLTRARGQVKAIHKRCWMANMWCKSNWSAERHTYFDGKAWDMRTAHLIPSTRVSPCVPFTPPR